ncbi:MAG: hypothetical protein SW833_11290 [Cyanobacteriota bacterium]|nr:hypothetical protein [Cyanobacteriota bacterium]
MYLYRTGRSPLICPLFNINWRRSRICLTEKYLTRPYRQEKASDSNSLRATVRAGYRVKEERTRNAIAIAAPSSRLLRYFFVGDRVNSEVNTPRSDGSGFDCRW